MWALGRRTALFLVSYAPLAAMFLALRWPQGWGAGELARLAVAVIAAALLLVALFTLAFASGRVVVRVATAVALAGAAIVALAIAEDWTHPLVLHPATPRTSAAAAAVALFFVVAGVGLLAVILRNAGRGTPVSWTVTEPRDQGGAVAGYLASYLLPLLNPDAHGTRIAVAYALYLLTLYVIFMRSEGLVTVNPMIYLFRYRIYDVRLAPPQHRDGGRRVLVLSRVPLGPTTDVEAVAFGDDCYVIVDREEEAT